MKQKKTLRGLALALALILTMSSVAQAAAPNEAALLDEARQILRENYIDPISEEILALPSIGEITAALGDPFTYYMSAEEYQAFQNDLNDTTIIGIGVMIEKMATALKVISVAPNSPAEKAGLRIGDLLVAADGVTMEEAGSPDALAALIPGAEGTAVAVTYQRDGTEHSAVITRATVVFPIVTGKVVDGHIGWITCTSFGETTGDYFEQYITEENDQADRWVVDLRGNPGGLGVAVIQAASYVLGNIDIAYTVDQQMNAAPWRLNLFPVEVEPILNEPMILLVDGNSASASELYAAAMRDYGAALVIGERTYGKGIGQGVVELSDGSVMKVTSFRYYSPNWVTPDHSGVLPDLVVDPGQTEGVAKLLSGSPVKTPGDSVLVVKLAGTNWYVDKAASAADKAAFTALLEALPADAALTLNGKSVTVAEVAAAWGADYSPRAFSDLEGSAYADAIAHMAVLGLVSGGGDGTFDPQGRLTRAQLCAMLTQAMGYWVWETDETLPFTDVAGDAWYHDAVEIMYRMGFMEGVGGGRFDPEGVVTHEQLLTIVGRMGSQADLTVWERLETMSPEALTVPAVAKFAPWAQPAAATAEAFEYLCKPLEQIDPAAPATREEAAATAYRLMRYMGVITLAEDFTPAE